MPMIIWVFLFLLQIHGVAIITNTEAYAFGAENQIRDKDASVSSAIPTGRSKSVVSIRKALETYDRAFQSSDIDALQQIFADDIVMYEQGTQDIGRVAVLTNHLGPELQTFQEMTADFTDLRIRESKGMAIITRQFSIKGIRQGNPFFIRGSETQGWDFREGRWQLSHIHMSFPPSR